MKRKIFFFKSVIRNDFGDAGMSVREFLVLAGRFRRFCIFAGRKKILPPQFLEFLSLKPDAVNGNMPAIVAVWIPNILYAGIAWYLYKKAPQ